MRAITLVNHKGGVGKTTITVCLAEALATRGDSVLVVDMDPQANATRRLGIPSDELTYSETLVQVLDMEKGPILPGSAEGYIRRIGWQNAAAEMIHVLPSNYLLGVRDSDAGKTGAIRRLKRALSGIAEQYDWVLVDTPPSLGHLTQMAFTFAGEAMAVASPEHDAVEGAIRLREFLEDYGEDMDDVTFLGIVVNLIRANTTLHDQYLKAMMSTFPGQVLEPHIPLRVELGSTMSKALPPSGGNAEVWAMAQLLATTLKGE